MPMDAEVIIVGAGPAGLSAALILGRSCRRVLVFDHGRPRNRAAHAVHGFLTRDGVTPDELHSLGLAELTRYDTVTVEHVEVTEATLLEGGGFRIVLTNGRVHTSQKLLLATGVVDLVPEVPGLLEMYGTSVFHCPYCDGWELRDAPVAVYGRG